MGLSSFFLDFENLLVLIYFKLHLKSFDYLSINTQLKYM